MKPGLVVRENRLIPVTTKSKSNLEKILGKINRHTVRNETLVCAMVSPDGKTGVFIDESGKEYLLTDKEISARIQYVNAKYVKKDIPQYVTLKKSVESYKEQVKDFVERSDTPKRYKDWTAYDGTIVGDTSVTVKGDGSLQESLNESRKYKKGQKYTTDDKEFSFEVIGVSNDYVRVRDLDTKKVYKIELSDLELSNPKLLKEEGEDVQ